MLLTMPAMRVNASSADTGMRRDDRRVDDMPSVVRAYVEFAISLMAMGLARNGARFLLCEKYFETAAAPARSKNCCPTRDTFPDILS